VEAQERANAADVRRFPGDVGMATAVRVQLDTARHLRRRRS